MGYSLCFMVATCLGGDLPAQAPDAPCCTDGTVSTKGPAPWAQEQGGLLARLKGQTAKSAECGCEEEKKSEGFGTRLRHLFGGHKSASTPCCASSDCCGCQGQSASPPVIVQTPPAVAPVVQPVIHEMPTTNGDIKDRFLPRVGCAPDYTWVTGQLAYVHTDGGLWVLRYSPLDREDRFGGSVILADAISLRNFRDGDLVTVHGEVLNEGRVSKHLGAAYYRVNAAELIERGGD